MRLWAFGYFPCVLLIFLRIEEAPFKIRGDCFFKILVALLNEKDDFGHQTCIAGAYLEPGENKASEGESKSYGKRG